MGDIQYLESDYGIREGESIKDNQFFSKINIIDIASYGENMSIVKSDIKRKIEEISIGKCILPNTKYSITVDSKSQIEIEEIKSNWGDNIDIVRVKLHKKLLDEGLKYCQEMDYEGYKVCIIPEQIAQYESADFLLMLKSISTWCPLAIYIYDNLGLLKQEYLQHFIELINKELSLDIALGLCLTNSEEHFNLVRQCIVTNHSRNYILDGSCLGEAEKKNLLNLTRIWNFVSGLESGKEKIQQYNLFVKEMYEKYCIYCRLEDYISACNQCDPMYAYYYVNERKVAIYELDSILKRISDEDKYSYIREKANTYLKSYRGEYWGKKLGVILVTANREKAIQYYLDKVAEMFQDRAIDLIIYDSSTDEGTKNVVQKYIFEGYSHVHYDFYDGEFDGISIDEKVICAYKKYAKEYEYLWISRDGIIINIEQIINDLGALLNKNMDLIVVDDSYRDIHFIGTKYYDDIRIFFKERCMQMTVLGATIIKSKLIQEIIIAEPLDKIKNYGMWQPIAFFNYLSDKKVNLASYVGALFLPNLEASQSSFWTKRLLWQWGERWYTMISELPEIYMPFKEYVLKDEMIDFHPFSVRFIAKCRENNGLTLRQIRKYQKYIPYVCETSIWKFYILALVPKFLIKYVVDRPNSLFYDVSRKLYKFCLVDR